jgi:hypothetical protein
MTTADAYHIIHRRLTEDRRIWATVSPQAAAETDDALTALEWLRQAAGHPAPQPQPQPARR